jgi:hypothetical protein
MKDLSLPTSNDSTIAFKSAVSSNESAAALLDLPELSREGQNA